MKLKTPSICASVISRSVEEFLKALENVGNADLVELRADGLETKSYESEVIEFLTVDQ